tara:strand:+ start:916 stop:1311 length:396 start_codon:yes stop_codon:yes gene_type:complete
MKNLDSITNEVKNGFPEPEKIQKINLDDIVNFLSPDNPDIKNSLVSGRVFQTNKNMQYLDTLFKLLEEEIGKIETKNNRDADNTFFNLNKKMLFNNMHNMKEIIKHYNINEERILYFLLGTVIQYIYESRK